MMRAHWFEQIERFRLVSTSKDDPRLMDANSLFAERWDRAPYTNHARFVFSQVWQCAHR